MITAKLVFIDTTHRVKSAADRANFRNLGHMAAVVRQTAIRSIKRSKSPSKPGQPPRTRKRRALPRSILFAAERDGLSAIVGPVHSRVGVVGEAHEFGIIYKGAKFPERPFMGPALEENADRMAPIWQNSIGE